MKKSKFILLFIVLFTLLVTIVGFIYFFHAPYNAHKQSVNQVKYTIQEEYQLENLDPFYPYHSRDTYYIGMDETMVYVFDENNEMITSQERTSLQEELVKQRLTNDYGVTDFTHFELGYENETLCYLCCDFSGDETKYIYLNALDGSEIKFYELR